MNEEFSIFTEQYSALDGYQQYVSNMRLQTKITIHIKVTI